MRYEDQPLCETCAARYPTAGIRHPRNHARDSDLPFLLGMVLALVGWHDADIGLWWVAVPVALGAVLLFWLAVAIVYHELIDRPRYRRGLQAR